MVSTYPMIYISPMRCVTKTLHLLLVRPLCQIFEPSVATSQEVCPPWTKLNCYIKIKQPWSWQWSEGVVFLCRVSHLAVSLRLCLIYSRWSWPGVKRHCIFISRSSATAPWCRFTPFKYSMSFISLLVPGPSAQAKCKMWTNSVLIHLCATISVVCSYYFSAVARASAHCNCTKRIWYQW